MIQTPAGESVSRRIFADTMVVGSFLSLVKMAGAAKIILMAGRFGTSDELDAFLIAFALPAFFAEAIAGSLPAALVPALIGVREARGRQAMARLHGSVTLGVLGLLVIGGLLLAAVSPAVLQLIGSGFTERKRAFAQDLFPFLLPLLPMGGLSVMWRSALVAEERFAVSSLAAGMTPIVSVLALLFARPGASVWLLAEAALAGMALELLLLGLAMRQRGLPLVPRWGGWDEAMRGVLTQYLPLIAAAVISGGNLLIDQAVAATLPAGSVAALSYGTKLASVLAAIAGGAVGTAALPHFSRMIATSDWSGVRRTARTNGRLILLAAAPAAALLILYSDGIVRLVFPANSFSDATAGLVASVQRLSLPQIPLSILLTMFLRLISAMNANRLLLHVAVVNLCITAAGGYVLSRSMGVPGIALAGTVAMSVSLILVISQVRRRTATAHMLDSSGGNGG